MVGVGKEGGGDGAKYNDSKKSRPSSIYISLLAQRPNSWKKSRQKYEEFSALLFTVISAALLEISIYSNSRSLLQLL